MASKKFLSLLLLILASIIPAGYTQNLDDFEKLQATFNENVYPTKSIPLPYRERTFFQEKDEPLTLVVYLHDSKFGGDNNRSQLRSAGINYLVPFLEDNGHKVTLVAPQCRIDRRWYESYASIGDPMHKILSNFISSYVKEHGIDPKRVVLVGHVAGGTGAWTMLSKYPKMFHRTLIVHSSPQKKYISQGALNGCQIATVVNENDRYLEDKLDEVKDILTTIQKKSPSSRISFQKFQYYSEFLDESYSVANLLWLME